VKVQILRDRTGAVIATAPEPVSEEAAAEPAVEEGQELETIDVRRGDLFDLEAFYKRSEKKS
jgi:hypothetical protein